MPYILIAIGVILLILLVTNIHVVQQSRAYVVERLGAYNTTWGVGLHVKLPILDRVAKKVSLRKRRSSDRPKLRSSSGGGSKA